MSQSTKPSSCFDEWFRSITLRSYVVLETDANLIGRVDIPLGGRSHIAGVEMELQRENLGPTWSLGQLQESQEISEYAEEAVFGLLDVCLTQDLAPICGFHIKIKKLDIHPVHSSPFAFRLAGREAGRDLLKQLKAYPGGLEYRYCSRDDTGVPKRSLESP